jgi:uncharacterized membrane protein YkvA (DUF1232 family)
MLERLKTWAAALKREALVLWFASRDPRAPWYAKGLAVLIVAYALSPIDLIPDFIPVIGYLDEIILLPGAIWLALKLMPREVLLDSRARARAWLEAHTGRIHAAGSPRRPSCCCGLSLCGRSGCGCARVRSRYLVNSTRRHSESERNKT